jgi:hypothetical protein
MVHALDEAREIMERFGRDTGVTSDAPPRRYLWTDAFAVCNYLGLHQATGESVYLDRAVTLVDQVHAVLGRHRADDPRSGWLSGLDDLEGARHPTAGGLRIGKPEPERAPGEPLEAGREWDRDGQYYHYLTRWMHALNRMARISGRDAYHRWAVELAHAAHAGFVRPVDGGWSMAWKMSVDLSRPLVPSMGSHDPLDGLLTLCELYAAAPEDEPVLETEIGELAEMCEGRRWATDDPLGLGGLLGDAARVSLLLEARRPAPPVKGARGELLLETLLEQALIGLRAFVGMGSLQAPAGRRLAFRELGLAIGLAGVQRAGLAKSADDLNDFLPLRAWILDFWREDEHRRVTSWTDHRDINEVMLATALAPAGYLDL